VLLEVFAVLDVLGVVDDKRSLALAVKRSTLIRGKYTFRLLLAILAFHTGPTMSWLATDTVGMLGFAVTAQ
jgi:hypothetical protein